MSEACNELERVVADDERGARVIRYSDDYQRAYEAAKRIIAEAEKFTQGNEAKRLAIADAFSQQHRSHQQGFVRGVVIPVLATLEYNARHNNIDPRNRNAAEFAIHALEAADKNNATWMPFI